MLARQSRFLRSHARHSADSAIEGLKIEVGKRRRGRKRSIWIFSLENVSCVCIMKKNESITEKEILEQKSHLLNFI